MGQGERGWQVSTENLPDSRIPFLPPRPVWTAVAAPKSLAILMTLSLADGLGLEPMEEGGGVGWWRWW